jgi:hypothetical protein
MSECKSELVREGASDVQGAHSASLLASEADSNHDPPLWITDARSTVRYTSTVCFARAPCYLITPSHIQIQVHLHLHIYQKITSLIVTHSSIRSTSIYQLHLAFSRTSDSDAKSLYPHNIPDLDVHVPLTPSIQSHLYLYHYVESQMHLSD